MRICDFLLSFLCVVPSCPWESAYISRLGCWRTSPGYEKDFSLSEASALSSGGVQAATIRVHTLLSSSRHRPLSRSMMALI